MKTITKRSLILTACLALVISLIGILFIFSSQSISAHAASGQGGRPAITATSTVDSTKNYGGKLIISSVELPLDQTAVYSNTAAGSVARLRATPDTHFKFDQDDASYVFKITPSSGSAIYITYAECTLQGTSMLYDLTLADLDYQIEVNFIAKVYTLNWTTEYYEGTAAPFKNSGFTCTTGSAGVSWGTSVAFENTILPNSEGIYTGGVRFAYAQIKYAAGDVYYNMGLTNEPSLAFEKSHLDAFVVQGVGPQDGTINIIGVYVQMINVEIQSSSTEYNESAIQIVAISPVRIQEEGPLKSYIGAATYQFDKGTNLTIYAISNRYFNFDGFDISNEPGFDKSRSVYTNKSLASELTVVANFTPAEFTLYIRGIQVTIENEGTENEEFLYGNYVDIDNNGSVIVGETSVLSSENGTLVYAFESLINAKFNVFEGFKYVDIAFKSGKNYYPFENKIINPDFIRQFVHNNEIVIVVRLIRQFSLDVIIPSTAADMGDYKITRVSNGQTINLSQEKYFDAGTELLIEALPKTSYHAFIDYLGVALDDRLPGNKAQITMSYNRTVNMTFRAAPFVLKDNTNTDFTFSKDSFNINEVLVITYDNKSGDEIKDWKINGKSWQSFGKAAKLDGNVLTITATSDFIKANASYIQGNVAEGFSIKLTNEVTAGMSTGILLAIMLPSVSIPLALAVLLTFMLINSRRKKLIKQMLTEKVQRDVTFNTGSYISDLKEGKISGGVTKEDIKKAMKEKKKK